MEVFPCAVCGRDSARLVKRPFDAIYNKIPIRLDSVERYECERCGESTFDAEQHKAVSEKVKSKAREGLNLLPPEAIVGIRKRYNLSQAELENLFGLGEKVVIRWEKGRVLQSKTADVLLRLMDQNPAIVEDLRKIHA
jgi:putative zinc finger/helix-turn-helix YgiT family protein